MNSSQLHSNAVPGSRARLLALILAGVGVALVSATLLLWWLNGVTVNMGEAEMGDLLMALSCCVVAGLILRVYARHRIGWLLLAIGLLWGSEWFGLQYAHFAFFTHPEVLPAADLVFWFSLHTWVPGLSLVVWLMLLFPTGTLLAPRWSWIGIVASSAALLQSLLGAIASWRYRGPLSFEFERLLVEDPYLSAIRPLGVVLLLIVFLSMFPALLAVFLRMRRASGVERQQVKWFLYGAAFLTTLLLAMSILAPTGEANIERSGWVWFGDLLYLLAPSLLPGAIGVAILRYRLYAIDLIIRRTLVYSTLTALLALLYWGTVITLQGLLRWLTGQGQNPLITVLSTLAIAALFTPLHRRVQNWIDRRFFRHQYDAEQILANFADTVRNETDLNRLNEKLIQVVQETVQPIHTTLWLRQPEK